MLKFLLKRREKLFLQERRKEKVQYELVRLLQQNRIDDETYKIASRTLNRMRG